jgi:hypothetical protein
MNSSYSADGFDELSDYFNGAPIGLHLTAPDGTITRANLAELQLLGYADHEDEYLGQHFGDFHSDAGEVPGMLQRLRSGESVVEHEATLVRRDGAHQRVLIYANARIENGSFCGVRCCTFPHPENLRPDIAEVGALRDTSADSLKLGLSEEERLRTFADLEDFFDNSPVSLHIVGGDGLVRRANKTELVALGYEPESYIGAHIAQFHADQAVIDGMLTDLVNGTPLTNFSATLSDHEGNKHPVMIYSNSRMRNGAFLNTRCFTVPAPKVRAEASNNVAQFAWPRNEDFGFTIPGRESPAASTTDKATLALRYIASRKRPEESLGFLARVSQALGATDSFDSMVYATMKLAVPFLADFICIKALGHGLAYLGMTEGQTQDEALAIAAAQMASTNGHAIVNLTAESDMAAAELHQKGFRSLISASLTIRNKPAGSLALLRQNTAARRDFGPADLALAAELARRLSFAIEIDSLSKNRRKRATGPEAVS